MPDDRSMARMASRHCDPGDPTASTGGGDGGGAGARDENHEKTTAAEAALVTKPKAKARKARLQKICQQNRGARLDIIGAEWRREVNSACASGI